MLFDARAQRPMYIATSKRAALPMNALCIKSLSAHKQGSKAREHGIQVVNLDVSVYACMYMVLYMNLVHELCT